jgi:hypothetical protein
MCLSNSYIHRDTDTPYNLEGYDREGFDIEGYNKRGFKHDPVFRKKIHRNTGTQWDHEGRDWLGFNAAGETADGWYLIYRSEYYCVSICHRDTNTRFNVQGFSFKGYELGKDRDFHEEWYDHDDIHEITGTLYALDGFDCYGFDSEGFDNDGFDDNGRNRAGAHRLEIAIEYETDDVQENDPNANQVPGN